MRNDVSDTKKDIRPGDKPNKYLLSNMLHYFTRIKDNNLRKGIIQDLVYFCQIVFSLFPYSYYFQFLMIILDLMHLKINWNHLMWLAIIKIGWMERLNFNKYFDFLESANFKIKKYSPSARNEKQ